MSLGKEANKDQKVIQYNKIKLDKRSKTRTGQKKQNKQKEKQKHKKGQNKNHKETQRHTHFYIQKLIKIRNHTILAKDL